LPTASNQSKHSRVTPTNLSKSEP